jgi:hypothetical protein
MSSVRSAADVPRRREQQRRPVKVAAIARVQIADGSGESSEANHWESHSKRIFAIMPLSS